MAGREEDAEGLLRYLDTILVIDTDSAQDRWMRAVLRAQTGRRQGAVEDTDWLLEHRPEGMNLDRVKEFAGCWTGRSDKSLTTLPAEVGFRAMSTIHEIEHAVQQLPPSDLAAFHWFLEFDARIWDEQIERDAASGRLDAFAEEALADLRAGRCTEL